jgi:hypothetical protein
MKNALFYFNLRFSLCTSCVAYLKWRYVRNIKMGLTVASLFKKQFDVNG